MKKINLTLLLLATSAASIPAQDRSIPDGFLPPPGLCRVWIDDVPAARQPAPTNCVKAERSRPNNARVIYGPSASLNTGRQGMVLTGRGVDDDELSKAEKKRAKAARKAQKERAKEMRQAEKRERKLPWSGRED
jgi:hypothetical protein